MSYAFFMKIFSPILNKKFFMHKPFMINKIWHASCVKCFVRYLLLCILLCIPLCLGQACALKQNPASWQNTPPHTKTTELLRADPGYIQWLVRQSLLHAAKESALMVSGSSLLWRHGYSVNPWPLLEKSSMWIDINPKQILDNTKYSSSLSLLAKPSFIASLQAKGLSLYLSDMMESESVWTYNTAMRDHESQQENTIISPISYNIAPKIGSEKDLKSLHALLRQSVDLPQPMQVHKNLLLLGSDILPSSTGLGPDFFLAARGHKDYMGTYAMVEIASQDWELLPSIEDEWQCQALSPSQKESLAQKGIIPHTFESDKQPILQKNIDDTPTKSHSWAATGKVRGVDGNVRRWVYAYTNSPMNPILQWNDPSALAQRMLSASIIKNTGILAMPLVGLSLEDFYGFAPSTRDKSAAMNPEPMLTAAKSLAHEVRMYGGWSWLRYALDTPSLEVFMHTNDHPASGPDFFVSRLGNLMKESIERGQATVIQDYFDALIAHNIDSTRLVHHMPNMSSTQYTAQDAKFAAQFMAIQSGLLFFPAQSVMSLAACLKTDQNPRLAPRAHTENIIDINVLQKDIMTIPNFSLLRDHAHLATAQVIARLPSSSSSLIVMSALNENSSLNGNYIIILSNFSNDEVVEKVHIDELFPHDAYSLYEIDMEYKYGGTRYIYPVNTDGSRTRGHMEDAEFSLEPKLCRILLVVLK